MFTFFLTSFRADYLLFWIILPFIYIWFIGIKVIQYFFLHIIKLFWSSITKVVLLYFILYLLFMTIKWILAQWWFEINIWHQLLCWCLGVYNWNKLLRDHHLVNCKMFFILANTLCLYTKLCVVYLCECKKRTLWRMATIGSRTLGHYSGKTFYIVIFWLWLIYDMYTNNWTILTATWP